MKKDDSYCYTYDELMERLDRDVPDNVVVLQRPVCPGRHEWKLETQGPEAFVAVCKVCGTRTADARVLLKLLDDFSPRRRRWMR